VILGDLKLWKQEEAAFAPAIRRAMAYLEQTDLTKLAPGKHEIDGDRMFCMVSEGRTRDRAELKAESHRAYIDIQYIASGEEKIGFARLTDEQHVVSDLLESDDALLYDELNDEIALVLRAGTYAIFFPADIHRPGGRVGEATTVKKIVMKIKLDTLTD